MKRILFSVLAISLLFSCQSAQDNSNMKDTNNEQTVTAGNEEWIPLFDGKTTAGWHTYGKSTVGNAWKVKDGALYLDASNKKDWQTSDGGDIVTDQGFDDFHLKLEWKISPNGNSGIIFYVHEDTSQYKQTWNTGLEMQVLDNNGHPDAKIHKHRAGDLYDLIASSEETVKPVGEWNQVEIISNKGHLVFFLNGTEIVSTTLWDEGWRELVAGSKFSSMPGFGTYKSGKIALQDHGDDVWFRNIMIRKL